MKSSTSTIFRHLLFLAVLLTLPHATAATTITFNELADGFSVTSQYQNLGVVFASEGNGVYASTFGQSFPTNVIIGTRPGQVTDSALVEILFVDPAHPSNPGICNFLSVDFKDLQLAGNGMYAYDINGNFLGSALSTRTTDNLGSIITETLTLSIPGMHRVVLDGTGGRGQGDVAFDNVTIGTVVPEPASGAALGASALLLLLHRKRRE
ncbi:PEP-CTERM sorting domain-containing protein [Haloferula sp. BvORR071]|uniref:PEP-CTERM sorting domain-containing protein n=1 Tax=Haloferula sp. BvORR071 TaxID=1396141 RepID=UPI0005581BF9|nr:PEP-CTERM sorting domain-containing protein [Haloferula sp. BvORR071]